MNWLDNFAASWFLMFFVICLILSCCVCIGLRMTSRGGNHDDKTYCGYRVAVSNRLFKESFLRSNKELPCLHCKFIEMGTMACYQETCPHCGKVPPSRQKEINKYHENLAFLENERKSATNWQKEDGHSKYSTFGNKDNIRGVDNKSFTMND